MQTCFVPDVGGKHTSAFREVRAGLRDDVRSFTHIREVPIHSYLTEFFKSKMCVGFGQESFQHEQALAYPDTLLSKPGCRDRPFVVSVFVSFPSRLGDLHTCCKMW